MIVYAHLLCNICSHVWTVRRRFNTLAQVERYDAAGERCPKCGAESAIFNPSPRADEDDRDGGDAWKPPGWKLPTA